MFALKLTQIGNSVGVVLPKEAWPCFMSIKAIRSIGRIA